MRMNAEKTRNTVRALFMVALAKCIFCQRYAIPLTLNNPDFILPKDFFTAWLIFDVNFPASFDFNSFPRLETGLTFSLPAS